MKLPRLFLLVFLALTTNRRNTCCLASSFHGDPYKALGLSSDASQDEIRTSYRKLCLKYHPDKNVGKSAKEQQRCTEQFKNIQAAHSVLGDEQSRRSYDLRSSFGSGFGSTNTRQYTNSNNGFSPPGARFRDENVEAFYRAFAGAGGTRTRPSNPNFFRSRTTTNNPLFGSSFSTGNVFAREFFGKVSAMNGGSGSLKCQFVQKIKIPLQDLYNGRDNMDFDVKDSIWKSYSAAFRGGFGYLILYQSAIFSAPILRLSKWASLLFSALIFHAHVPRPTVHHYTANILPGYKDGTKITFRDAEPGFDIVFVVEEESHDRFTREGNDLHTTVDILASQAKEGCTIEVETLNPMEDPPTRIKLRPGEIKQSGDTVTVKHEGWPQRKTGGRGDLIIQFRIVRKLKESSSGRKKHPKSRKKRSSASSKKSKSTV